MKFDPYSVQSAVRSFQQFAANPTGYGSGQSGLEGFHGLCKAVLALAKKVEDLEHELEMLKQQK